MGSRKTRKDGEKAKPKSRKLTLRKETLRDLAPNRAKDAKGGAIPTPRCSDPVVCE